MKLLKALSSISENIKTVFILVLALINTFCGTMKANFILEDGKIMKLMKEKKQDKEFNIFLANIFTGGSF